VNLWLGGLVIAAAVAVAVLLMLFARRHAPAGGFCTDTDRAAGVFGVLGTFSAVVLAFVIFLAFESYVNAKEKAGQEAVSVTELSHTADHFPSPARAGLQSELICYARSVIGDEWAAMKDERLSPRVERWVDRLDRTIERGTLARTQPAAFQHWLAENAARREGRRGRAAEARPFVPEPLWFVLIVGALSLLGFMCLFADPAERFAVQAAMIGAVAAVVVSGLLVVSFLDRPYEDQTGSIQPVEMARTLELLERDAARTAPPTPALCDAGGRP